MTWLCQNQNLFWYLVDKYVGNMSFQLFLPFYSSKLYCFCVTELAWVLSAFLLYLRLLPLHWNAHRRWPEKQVMQPERPLGLPASLLHLLAGLHQVELHCMRRQSAISLTEKMVSVQCLLDTCSKMQQTAGCPSDASQELAFRSFSSLT